MNFVLDASVTIRWALNDGSNKDKKYADEILQSLVETKAIVPVLWHIEMISVLRQAEKNGNITPIESAEFLQSINALPIQTDKTDYAIVRVNTLKIARQYGLTGYDACYLELAIRKECKLATLDAELRKAATKAKVKLFN